MNDGFRKKVNPPITMEEQAMDTKKDSIRKNILNLINTADETSIVDKLLFPNLSMIDTEVSYTLALMGFSLTKIVFDKMINDLVEDQENKGESKAKKRKKRLQNKKVYSERKSGFIFQMCNQESMIIKEIEKENSDSHKDESKSTKKKTQSKSRSKSIVKESTAGGGGKKKKKRNKKNKIKSHNVVRKKNSDLPLNSQNNARDHVINFQNKDSEYQEDKMNNVGEKIVDFPKGINKEKEFDKIRTCMKRYENFYSEDEKHSQLSADPDYLDKNHASGHIIKDQRKTNSVQNGYEGGLDAVKRASSFTNSRKLLFDDIKSTSYCTKTLSSMTESYLLHGKKLRLGQHG